MIATKEMFFTCYSAGDRTTIHVVEKWRKNKQPFSFIGFSAQNVTWIVLTARVKAGMTTCITIKMQSY